MRYIKKPAPPQGNGDREVWMRRFMDWVSQFELTSVIGGIKKPNPNGGGYSLVFVPGKGGSAEISAGTPMYKIKSFQGDYMTCRTWDGVTEGGTNVYVAKPYKLRNSQTVVALDGVNITYVYDGGTLMRAATHPNFQSDVQKIIPRYLVNDIIHVGDSDTGVTAADGTPVVKIDLNVDGRYWARL